MASPAATITEPSSGPDDTDADPDYQYDGVPPEEAAVATGEASVHVTRDASRVFEGVVLMPLPYRRVLLVPARVQPRHQHNQPGRKRKLLRAGGHQLTTAR